MKAWLLCFCISQGVDVHKELWEIASLTLDPDIRQYIIEECLSYSLTPKQSSDVTFIRDHEKATKAEQDNSKEIPEKGER